MQVAVTMFDCAMRIDAMPGEQRSGDHGVIQQREGILTAVLLDVLGHGDEAAVLAGAVESHLQNCDITTVEPLDLMMNLHDTFRGSRGLVASIARIDAAAETLKYCGVGNIGVRILGPNATIMVNRDGVVCYRMVPPRQQRYPFTAHDTLLMHSDGIKSHFDVDSVAQALQSSAQALLDHLFARYVKGIDDAGALVVRVSACK